MQEELATEQRAFFLLARQRGQQSQQGVSFSTGRGDVFLVDQADAEAVSRYKWQSVANKAGSKRRTPYVAATINGRRMFLHRWLLQAPAGHHVDHIDGDPLNNCRANLRIVTPAENINAAVERRKAGAVSTIKVCVDL